MRQNILDFRKKIQIDWLTITCKTISLYEQILCQCGDRNWLSINFHNTKDLDEIYHKKFPTFESPYHAYISQYKDYGQDLVLICFAGVAAQEIFNHMYEDPSFLMDLKLNCTRIDLKYNLGEYDCDEDWNPDPVDFCKQQQVFDEQNKRQRVVEHEDNDEGFVIRINKRENSYFSRFSRRRNTFYYELELKKGTAKSVSFFLLYRDWKGFCGYLYSCFMKEGRSFVCHELTTSLCDYVDLESKYFKESQLFLKNRKVLLRRQLFCPIRKWSGPFFKMDGFANNCTVLTESFLFYLRQYSLKQKVNCMIALYVCFVTGLFAKANCSLQEKDRTYNLSAFQGVKDRLIRQEEFFVVTPLHDILVLLGTKKTKVNKEKAINQIVDLKFTGKEYTVEEDLSIYDWPFLTTCEFVRDSANQECLYYQVNPLLYENLEVFSITIKPNFTIRFEKAIKQGCGVKQVTSYCYTILAYILAKLCSGECCIFEEQIYQKSSRAENREKGGTYYFSILQFLKEEEIIKNWTFGIQYSWKKNVCKKTFLDYWCKKRKTNQIWIDC